MVVSDEYPLRGCQLDRERTIPVPISVLVVSARLRGRLVRGGEMTVEGDPIQSSSIRYPNYRQEMHAECRASRLATAHVHAASPYERWLYIPAPVEWERPSRNMQES